MNLFLVIGGGPLPDILYLYAFLFAILIAVYLISCLFDWMKIFIGKIRIPKKNIENLPLTDDEDNNLMESRAVTLM